MLQASPSCARVRDRGLARTTMRSNARRLDRLPIAVVFSISQDTSPRYRVGIASVTPLCRPSIVRVADMASRRQRVTPAAVACALPASNFRSLVFCKITRPTSY